MDVVIAGHTHSYLNTRVPNRSGAGDKLVIEAKSLGIAYDRVRMTIDRATRRRDRKGRRHADDVARAGDPGPADRPARVPVRAPDRAAGRSRAGPARAAHWCATAPGTQRGSLIAVAARAQRRLAKADIAVVNEGNARASVDAGPITYAELFEASAYEHQVLRMELTGREIGLLEAQQTAPEPDVPLHWTGMPLVLNPNRTYTVAANELLVEGSDDFSVLRRGRNVRRMGTDLEALVKYVEAERIVG